MRSIFPGHFRPTDDNFADMWKDSLFAVDANVLLNLYRYSPDTRTELQTALETVKAQLFVPHQAAKEFLNNRVTVTAAQAEEYGNAIKIIDGLKSILSNKKKHPVLPDTELTKFFSHLHEVSGKLEAQRVSLLDRLTNDGILDFIQSLSDNRTGTPFDENSLIQIAADGEERYKNKTPPGYKDAKKDVLGDPYRKFGDLILWKQLIDKAKVESKSIIFITDDKKEDWWLAEAGRTIGPRIELREEFLSEAGQNFWMYTVEKFIKEVAKKASTPVNSEAIEEIIEVREEIDQINRQGGLDFLDSILRAQDRFNPQRGLASISSAAEQINRIGSLEQLTSISKVSDQINRLGDLDQLKAISDISDRINQLGGLDNLNAMSKVSDNLNIKGIASLSKDYLNPLGGFESIASLTSAKAHIDNHLALKGLASLSSATDYINQVGGLASFTSLMNAKDKIDNLAIDPYPSLSNSLNEINRLKGI
ncbi:MAG: PIN domain-containing protein [Candidatus Nitrotoga sp.]|nr:PIN domain-containing protein [Candidatus Nitrotoga sp.]MDO9446514.1 PIN domain-containing protein [Candidatus Nitrotoga sp.]MDP1638374.1 PIN domain-containing protein [Candidatus Nitrotoga sp.]MDP1855355.1 PIN domain-containing protein [Candidatus Nitrotoga sp.]MDP3498548.1 PIN domain-containing protein [Candidatus Nitrotoga sp.]